METTGIKTLKDAELSLNLLSSDLNHLIAICKSVSQVMETPQLADLLEARAQLDVLLSKVKVNG